jgi:hypothetical protein
MIGIIMNKQGKRSKKISRGAILRAIKSSMEDQRALLDSAKKIVAG